jgi:diaminopimelate epimerase
MIATRNPSRPPVWHDSVRFAKYHALGNDYLVVDPKHHPHAFSTREIIRICHRNFGIGSDGILWGPLPARDGAAFALRIFNPDGSETQKSGNGLRIFCRYLFDQGLVQHAPFKIHTLGGVVEATVHEAGQRVTVAMGCVSFDSARIPVAGAAREVIRESMTVGGETLTFSSATIGNPHCVVERPATSTADVHRLGPLIETNVLFPERTNVQFLTVLDRNNIAIEIWERGAGYTLASGSSSSAAAAVAHRMGLVDNAVDVHLPGGTIEIKIGDNYAITMTGPVSKVADGVLADEVFSEWSVANE